MSNFKKYKAYIEGDEAYPSAIEVNKYRGPEDVAEIFMEEIEFNGNVDIGDEYRIVVEDIDTSEKYYFSGYFEAEVVSYVYSRNNPSSPHVSVTEYDD